MEFKFVTLHCTDTPNGLPVNLQAIEKDHIAKGFGGTGYHYIINADGTRTQTRPLEKLGSHVKGHNTGNIGICLAGTDKFSDAQFKSLREILLTLQIVCGLELDGIYGHYEFDTARSQGKTCPNIRSADVVAWYLTEKEKFIEKYLL